MFILGGGSTGGKRGDGTLPFEVNDGRGGGRLGCVEGEGNICGDAVLLPTVNAVTVAPVEQLLLRSSAGPRPVGVEICTGPFDRGEKAGAPPDMVNLDEVGEVGRCLRLGLGLERA